MVGHFQFLVAGGNGPMLLEAVDEALDPVALPIRLSVEAHPALRLGAAAGDDRPDPAAAQVGADRRPGVALVSDDALGPHPWPPLPRAFDSRPLQQGRHQRRLVPLPRRQERGHRLTGPLGAEVEFRREAAPAAAKGLIAAPFLAPAACWWARIVVLSRKCWRQSTSPRASASACNAAKTRSQRSACCQRRKREYTVCHGPYRSGRSRQGTPVASRQRMPLRMVRWSWAG